MELARLDRKITTNLQGGTEFTLKADAKAFGVIFGNIYSDKIKSPLRELMANAYDSHVAKGIPHVPIEVELPSVFNPTVTVRDHGVGLSKEFMLSKYTVAFYSSKEDDNTQVGAFGIGRLSVLGYVDTYNVTSRHGGLKSHYVVFKNPKGIPDITHLGDSPLSDPTETGLEVSYAASRGDQQRFKEAVRDLSFGFDVPPKVSNGLPPVEIPEGTITGKYSLDGGEYTYRVFGKRSSYVSSTDPRGLYNGIHVRMGCVTYPVDTLRVPLAITQKSITVDVPLGSVSVTASRESLDYSKESKTLGTLDVVFNSVLDRFVKDIQTSIDSKGSLFEASQFYADSGVKDLGFDIGKFTYKGSPLINFVAFCCDNTQVGNSTAKHSLAVNIPYETVTGNTPTGPVTVTKYGQLYRSKKSWSGNTTSLIPEQYAEFKLRKGSIVPVVYLYYPKTPVAGVKQKDYKSKFKSYITRHIRSLGYNDINDATSVKVIQLVSESHLSNLKEFLEFYPKDRVVDFYTQVLPWIEADNLANSSSNLTTVTAGGSKATQKVTLAYRPFASIDKSNWQSIAKSDFLVKYPEDKSYKITVDPYRNIVPNNVIAFAYLLVAKGVLTEDQIVVVSKTSSNYLTKHKELVDTFSDNVRAILKDYLSRPYVDYSKSILGNHLLYNKVYININDLSAMVNSGEVTNKYLKVLLKVLDKHIKKSKLNSVYLKASTLYLSDFPPDHQKVIPSDLPERIFNKFTTKYPLFRYISGGILEKDQAALDYMNEKR